MIDNYINVIKKSFTYSGRSSPNEYWQFIIMHLIIWGVLISIISIVDLGPILNMFAYVGYLMLGIIPQLSVSVRRMHDTNHSGWYMVLALIPPLNLYILYLLVIGGDSTINKYGPKPEK